MGDRPTLLLLLEPIPLHYDPSYHRCLLHLLLSFLSRSASTMTRGAIMSTSFQDSFTPSFESYRSSSYLSFLPSIHRLSFSLCVQRNRPLRGYTLLFFLWLSSLSSYSSPVIFLVSLLFFFFLFFFLVFARVPYLSPPSFLFPRLFIYAAFSVLHSPRCFLDELLFIPPDYVLLMCSNELRSFLFLFLLPPLMQRRCNRVNSRGNRSERRLLPF